MVSDRPWLPLFPFWSDTDTVLVNLNLIPLNVSVSCDGWQLRVWTVDKQVTARMILEVTLLSDRVTSRIMNLNDYGCHPVSCRAEWHTELWFWLFWSGRLLMSLCILSEWAGRERGLDVWRGQQAGVHPAQRLLQVRDNWFCTPVLYWDNQFYTSVLYNVI